MFCGKIWSIPDLHYFIQNHLGLHKTLSIYGNDQRQDCEDSSGAAIEKQIYTQDQEANTQKSRHPCTVSMYFLRKVSLSSISIGSSPTYSFNFRQLKHLL